MRPWIVIALLCAAPLMALPAAQGQTPQQNRMKECNATAGTRQLDGDSRKQFMSDCLAGRPTGKGASSAQTAQRQRMTSCNATAAERKLSGTARQDFMKDCLSGG